MNSNLYRKIMVATDGSENVKKLSVPLLNLQSLAGQNFMQYMLLLPVEGIRLAIPETLDGKEQ